MKADIKSLEWKFEHSSLSLMDMQSQFSLPSLFLLQPCNQFERWIPVFHFRFDSRTFCTLHLLVHVHSLQRQSMPSYQQKWWPQSLKYIPSLAPLEWNGNELKWTVFGQQPQAPNRRQSAEEWVEIPLEPSWKKNRSPPCIGVSIDLRSINKGFKTEWLFWISLLSFHHSQYLFYYRFANGFSKGC